MGQNNLEVGMRCIKYMLLCVTAIFVVSFTLKTLKASAFANVIIALFSKYVGDSNSISDKSMWN